MPLAGASAVRPVRAETAAHPTLFDPIAFVAEMRAVGAVLEPHPWTRTFAFDGADGIPGDILVVGARWSRACAAEPLWTRRVFRVLMAEQFDQAADAELIAECSRVESLAERAHTAWDRLRGAEERYRALCPPRPLLPETEVVDREPLSMLRARVAVYAASDSASAESLAHARGCLERMKAYEAASEAAFRRCRVAAAIAVAERWNARLVEASRELALITAETRAELEAKARTWPTLRQLAPGDLSFEWAEELGEMVIRETIHLGTSA